MARAHGTGSRVVLVALCVAVLAAGACGARPHVYRFDTGNETIPPDQMTTFPTTTTWTAPTTGTWKQIEPGPLATRGEPFGAWTGTEMLVVGGLIIDQYASISDGGAYNPTTNTWRKIAVIPEPGRVRSAVWTGSQLVVLRSDGINVEPMKDGWVYDTRGDHWRKMSTAPTGLGAASLFWTGSQVLVWQPNGALLYDPTRDAWTTLPPPSTAGALSTMPGATWTDGRLAVNGTIAPAAGGPVQNRLFLLDPAKQTWQASSPPPIDIQYARTPIWSGAQVVLISQVQINGEAASYNPATNGWRKLPPPDLSVGPGLLDGVHLTDGRVVIITGNPGTPLNVLDLKTGTWRTSGPAPGRGLSSEGAFVSTGRSVIVWGIGVRPDNFVDPGSPNVGWSWTP